MSAKKVVHFNAVKWLHWQQQSNMLAFRSPASNDFLMDLHHHSHSIVLCIVSFLQTPDAQLLVPAMKWVPKHQIMTMFLAKNESLMEQSLHLA